MDFCFRQRGTNPGHHVRSSAAVRIANDLRTDPETTKTRPKAPETQGGRGRQGTPKRVRQRMPGAVATPRDTFHVTIIKNVGRSHRQSVVDTWPKVALAGLHDRRTPIRAADLLTDRVVPFFHEREIDLCMAI